MADRVLARLGAAYRLELRLMGRHWSFFVLHGLWALLLIATFGGSVQAGTARVMLGTVIRFIALSLLSLIALFATGISASRRRQTHFDTLEDAFPTGLEVPLGRWLACLTIMSSFLIEPLLDALAIGPWASFLESGPLFLAESVLLLAFFTAGTWWLTSLFGLRRWGYPLLAVIWISFLVAPGLLYNLGIPGSSLLNLTGNGMPSWSYSELFGRLILGGLPDWADLFYGGLMLLFLAAFAWREHIRRFQRRSALVGALTAAALLTTLIGGGGYIARSAATTAQIDQLQAFHDADSPGQVLPADLPEAVAAYDLSLDLTDPALPRFSADLEIVNRDEAPITSLTMTLAASLEITDASLPLERDGSRLDFTLPEPLEPGETLPLSLAYQGTVQRAEDYSGNLRYFAFLQPDGVRLPLGAGWYPLVGWTASATNLAAAVPARFHLQVEGADNLTFVSNLPATGPRTFETAGALYAMLFGSPSLAIESVGQVTLATANDILPYLRERVETRFEPDLAYLARFFPETPRYPLLIIGIDNPFAGLPGADSGTVEQRVLLTETGGLRDNSLRSPLYDFNRMVIHLGGTDLYPIANLIQPFLWSHYQTQGELDGMRAMLASWSGYPVDPAIDVLLDLYTEYGDAGIIRLLRQAQHEGSARLWAITGEPGGLENWLREAIGEP